MVMGRGNVLEGSEEMVIGEYEWGCKERKMEKGG